MAVVYHICIVWNDRSRKSVLNQDGKKNKEERDVINNECVGDKNPKDI